MRTLSLDHRCMLLCFDDMGTGLPVVLLHAFPLDRTMWRPQLAPLSAAGFRVLAPDLPEFGDSTPGTEVFSIDVAADVVAEFLELIDIEEAVVCGLSMGGYVALALARRHPERLAGLVLADTRGAPDDDEAKQKRDRLIAEIRAKGPVAAGDALVPRLLAEETRSQNPALLEEIRGIALRQTSAGLVAGLYGLRDRPDAEPWLSSIAVRTLVMVGELDTVTPPEHSERLTAAIPDAELVRIPAAGHLSNLENPQVFNASLLAFLKKLG